MPNTKNLKDVEVLKEKLSRAQSVAVVEYAGTTVADQVQLRSSLKEVGGELYVTKNTLIDIAAGKGNLSASLDGMNALVLSYADAVAPIKKLFAFKKEKSKLTIKQGLFEGKVISADELEVISKLPSKEELIVKLMHTLQGPAYGLVNVLQAGPRNLVYALQAIADKK